MSKSAASNLLINRTGFLCLQTYPAIPASYKRLSDPKLFHLHTTHLFDFYRDHNQNLLQPLIMPFSQDQEIIEILAVLLLFYLTHCHQNELYFYPTVIFICRDIPKIWISCDLNSRPFFLGPNTHFLPLSSCKGW